MIKDRTMITGVVVFLILGSLLDAGSTDGIYIAASIGFFVLCIVYAGWCQRL